ncbi:adenylate/guanylate cyclase domain-containing protein [Peterkaempfera bronchialis]|uniref:Adenylate/guanylate cyclase domain-containing protein n=1 Tax=Peterkaempfera bronchialis TaxID=2126346 RepID=A0A345SZM3_9ACTN|nr:adenylate/guanylate cyclase domain-containing protein [Peterkaempfera bronchialis]AXI79178.1 adenylate/guanylate cyclase domain-containing protein [Peterkaempfera bronchialis]
MHCSSCRTPLVAGARFCSGCGTPCAPAAPADPATEERKVVTVVFCDLVGSTAISGRLDPEALRAVTLRYFEVMRRQIEAHGGTVEKFIGDAVMAVFGVPVMHEDDARRALAAALDMLTALDRLNTELAAAPGVRLDVRIGVNTGEVVAGSDASARQALVSGEVVNVAARLEQNAAAGQILIGPDTLRAAGAAAVAEDAGPLRLKGKADPVRAHRLLAVRNDDPELLRRFDIPFVGREQELAQLHLVLEKTTGTLGCHLATLYGEAGIGKTRLVREWLDRLDRTGTAVAHGTGRCRPYGDGGTLSPLADALRHLLEAAPEHPAALQPDADPGELADQAEALALLRSGLLLDGTPNPSVEDTCAAAACLLGGLARRRPLLLVLDDCHWADALLLGVLDRLCEDLDRSPVLLVCTARPELLDRHPGWGSGRLKAVSLMLPGLSAEESARLAAGLEEVGAHLADPESARVLERAEGNPLHLEQLLAMLADGGPPEELPPTVHALLGSRIDALGPAERTVLDLAAVVGREFDLDRLAALARSGPEGRPGGSLPPDGTEGDTVRAALRRLIRRRLVEPARRAPGGGPAFRFSSGLVHEVAYQGMAKRVRAERHERAAALPGGATDGTVGLHLEQAHRYRTELGLLDARTERLRRHAADRLAAAGAQALARADLRWADDLLRRAVAVSRPGEPCWAPAARRLAEAALARGRTEEGAALLRQVVSAATASGDPVSAAHARLTLAATQPAADPEVADPTAGPDVEPAVAGAAAAGPAAGSGVAGPVADPVAEFGTAAGPVAGPGVAGSVAEIGVAAGLVAGPGVDAEAGVVGGSPTAVARAVLPVFQAAGDLLGLARAEIRIAQDEQRRGLHTEADRRLTRALDHAVRADAEPERALALGAVGVSLWLGPEPVPSAVARCRALLAEHGAGRRTVGVTLNCPLAVLLALDDRPEEARACLAAAARLARELGYAEAAVFLPVFAAAVEVPAGRPERAEELLLEAERAGRELGGSLPAAVSRELARLLLARGEWRRALCRVEPDDRGLPLSEAADRDGLLARIAALRGDHAEAERLAERACDRAGRTDSPVARAVAALDRAHTLLLTGSPARAADAAAEAGLGFTEKGHRPGARWAARLSARAAATGPDAPYGEAAR